MGDQRRVRMDERFGRLSTEEAADHYQSLIDSLSIGVALLDPDGRLRFCNDRGDDLLGDCHSETAGGPVDVHQLSLVDESGSPIETEASPFAEPGAVEDVASERVVGVDRPSDDRVWLSIHRNAAFADDSSASVILTFEDVTDRIDEKRRLERRTRQQAVIARLGQLGLETDDLDEFMAEVCRTVSGVLGNEYCKVLELDASADELLLREGVGWNEGVVGSATVPSDENSQAGYTLLSKEPVVVEDLEAETRFSGPELLTEHDVVSGISTIIGSIEEPWGILGTHDCDHQEFMIEDVHFVQAVANVLATAIERWEHERALAAHNHFNDTIRDIALMASRLNSPREIEQRLCDRLVETGPYVFAWIGHLERASGRVTPTVSAGGSGRYLDGIEVTVDEDSTGMGPTGKAIRTGTPKFVQDIMNDPAYAPWREEACEQGYRSSAALPLAYEDATYGVLNVYASEPFAFDGPQAETLADLGELIGHAVHTITQRKALISDTVTELEFRVDISDHPLLDATTDEGVSIELNRRIPLGEDGYLQFVAVEGIERSEFETTIRKTADVEAVEYITERGDSLFFELTMRQFPLSTALAEFGGRVPKVTVRNGAFRVITEVPAETDIRDVVDSLQDIFPSAELLAQRATARSGTTRAELHRALSDELTDRQWTVLETAYQAGYFEWPRVKSGEEIAALLDISPPTFSEHIRTAEQVIVEVLLDGQTDRS